MKISESVKLLATIYYFRYEAAFRFGGQKPGEILQTFNGSTRDYVDFIRLAVWKRGSARMDTSSPSFEAFRLQCKRGNPVLGYWQDGCRKEMPHREYKGEGLGHRPQEEEQRLGHLDGRKLRALAV